MKKLLTILLVLISFSSFAQFEAGEYINSDTVKIDGAPLLLNTFKQGNLGGAGNIFYSTGASSQPASGTVNQVVGNNYIQNQNSAAQNANMWINGAVYSNRFHMGVLSYNQSIMDHGSDIYFTDASGTGIGQYYGGNKLHFYNGSGGIDLLSLNQIDYSAIFASTIQATTAKLTNLADGYLPLHQSDTIGLVNSNIYQDGGGNVGIGTTAPGTRLDVDGSITQSVTHGNNMKLWLSAARNGGGTGEVGLYSWISEPGSTWTGGGIARNMCNITNFPRINTSLSGQMMHFTESGNIEFVVENTSGTRYTPLFVGLNNNVGIGTTTPTEALDVNGNLIADVLKSRIPTGTPPLVVASTTKVDSLNAGLFDGKKANDFQLKSDTLTFDATLSDLADSSAAIRALANTKAVVSGTNNYIMKKTGANTLGNSNLIDYGSFVSSSVRFYAPTFYVGSTNYSDGYINLGPNRPGNNDAFIDLIGDQTYVDYGLRLVRDNTGADASSMLTHRGKGELLIRTEDSGRLAFVTKNTTAVTIDTMQNSGFGTLTPAARIHSQSTGTQARLGYDANKYTDLSTGSTGNLTIDPTGDTVKVVGAVNSTGGFFKNGVEITGGEMVYPPAGIALSTGTGWATSIIDNSSKWNNAYNYRLTGASGTSPLTLSLSANHLTGSLSSQLTSIGTLANSEGLLYNNGSGSFSYKTAPSGTIVGTTDSQALTNKSVNGVTLSTSAGTTNFLAGDGTYKAVSGSSKWTADTYGINYQSGNVGVGATSSSNAKIKGYTANSGVIGVYGYSVSDAGVYGGSSSSIGVSGYSVDNLAVSGVSTNSYGVYGYSTNSYGGVFSGLGVQATKYYVSSLNTAPASSTATGTTGEIRFTSDYIYVCVATNTWKRTQISTW